MKGAALQLRLRRRSSAQTNTDGSIQSAPTRAVPSSLARDESSSSKKQRKRSFKWYLRRLGGGGGATSGSRSSRTPSPTNTNISHAWQQQKKASYFPTKINLPELSSAESRECSSTEEFEPSTPPPVGYEIDCCSSSIVSSSPLYTTTNSRNRNNHNFHCSNNSLVQQQNDDDHYYSCLGSSNTHDNDDITTSSSLLSSYSSDDEDSTIASSVCGMERLQIQRQQRDRRLRRMLIGKRRIYELSLLHQEHAIQEWTFQSYQQKEQERRMSKTGKSLVSQEQPQAQRRRQSSLHCASLPPKMSTVTELWHSILFERYHTTSAAATVMFYSLSNAAFYLLLDSALNSIKNALAAYISPEAFFASAFCFGILLMRLSGYLWFWLDKESYNLVKFEMRNRECLGYFDAKLVRHLKSYPWIKSCINLVSFYTAYGAIINLYYIGIDTLAINPLFEWYQTMESELAELMPQGAAAAAPCAVFQEYFPNSYRGMLAYQLCQDEQWTMVQNLYHLVMFIAGVVIYELLGEKFVESCD